jgi:c-di-GMP-binding flagellar brake protein YcgR
MNHTTETTRIAKFADMDLRIGQRVQLIEQGPIQHKHYTSLIGGVEHEFIMLKVPTENGWAVPMREGQVLELRLFSGTSVYTFKSRIETLLLNPRNYMLLSFPDKIEEVRLRSHIRVRAALPIEVTEAVCPPDTRQAFRIADLSGSGAAIVGPASLGPVGHKVRFSMRFDLLSTGKNEHLDILADIKSVEPVHHKEGTEGHPPQYQHGVMFGDIDARLVLLVEELQHRKH